MSDLRLKFQKGDICALAAVLLLAACVALAFMPGKSGEENALLQIYQDGELIRQLPLTQDEQIQVGGDYINTIVVQDGRAAIAASDCPGEDCVHSGWIDAPGRSIVCLPNRVELRIDGAQDVDFVVR